MIFGSDVGYLDVKDGVNAPGTVLQLWDCNGDPNQQWLPSTSSIRWADVSQEFPIYVDLTSGDTMTGNSVRSMQINDFRQNT